MEYAELLTEADRRDSRKLFENMFPDKDTAWRGHIMYSRNKYSRHMAFLAATGTFREVAMMAANRSGKTQTGAYAITVWTTGMYPDWWDAMGCKRFPGPVRVWISGKTNETTRDILQDRLLGRAIDIDGRKGFNGEGMVPGHLLSDPTWRAGLTNSIDTVRVLHTSGRHSTIGAKSYTQGRTSFEGTSQDVIWLDEEPPLDVHTECLTRTATTNGIIIATYTPLMGMSEVAMRFLPDDANEPVKPRPNPKGFQWNEITPTRCVIFCGWDHVPHLTEATKKELYDSYPLHERDARTQGIPGLGDGAVYPLNQKVYICAPFRIPLFWPRVYGMDVGWNCTAVVWAAFDRDSGKVYIYAEHYMGQQPPAVHKEAILARGTWIPGVIDPTSGASSPRDGEQLLADYQSMGLQLAKANNAVEAGIAAVYNLFMSGRLVIFSTCKNLLEELRFYRRNNGKIVKKHDHAVDALRYLVVSGLKMARCAPDAGASVNKPINRGRSGY